MKSSTAAAILAITSAQAMAATIPIDNKQTNSNATHPNLVFMENVISPHVDDVSQICFSFNTDNGVSGFYYALQGPWGSGTGYTGSSGTICVPTSNSAGGAMFIGPDANPGPGSTKLECYFPSTGTANCDISLVDGYSSAVACVPSSTKQLIGGYSNLYNGGVACPDQQGPNCINTEGYAASQSDVNAFFQQGISSGNNYSKAPGIWVNCSQDYYFPTGDGLVCTVG
ncbi:hypothetical protein M409DRAFT_57497 [Zasmidium cellare ATCC 36951]|uniref:Ubiquitin 3 binding protein But2 C-terminal domain-containing protein n=1 Tax=Zasmidium cellare ATCC 36951 TaxID=1080233 RepID=A0A6A6CDX3_ZASCE|nr:uncharacterized protein M409DRAFT_57497 [Zasmidium cellare ATCC 36951]KAF2163626.1 hypothetical protein M409DRAFT_57497 [Zasmidium cellare ATCC 36951]